MSEATLSYLLGEMATRKEVMNGWDAALNVTEGAINRFFQDQYARMTGGSGAMTVARVFCGPALNSPHGSYCVVTQFSFSLAAPSFAFTGGCDTITVTQPITAGSTRSGSMPVGPGFVLANCGCVPDDPRVAWGPAVGVDLGAQPAVSAAVPLALVGGIVNPSTRTVALVMADGAFTMLNLVLKDVSASALADQVRDWFLGNGVTYQLASLDLSGAGSIPALTPTRFRFAVLRTGSGDLVVQILIVTDGATGAGPLLLEEPVPTRDGYSCTLMISSRIVFADILCAGFNGAGKPFKLYPRCASPAAGYVAVASPPIVITGSFSFGSCCSRKGVSFRCDFVPTYSGTKDSGFRLYQQMQGGGDAPTITVSANNPVSLAGSGGGQAIRIDPQPPTVTVTGGSSSTINENMQAIIGNDFGAAMAGISFSSITTFALRSLLFPSSMIKMSVVEVPTDLVIVGTFEPG